MNELLTERELVERFYSASRRKKDLKKQLEETQAELDEAESRLIETLQSQEKSESATYDGIGYATITKPQVRASCEEKNREKLFEYLTGAGRKDLIKTVVDPRSLSAFVRERLESDSPGLPEFITYFLQTGIRVYDERGKWVA